MTGDFEQLERVYDLLAEALDAVGREKEAVFLSKVCLILANRLGDAEAVRDAIAIAKRDLDD